MFPSLKALDRNADARPEPNKDTQIECTFGFARHHDSVHLSKHCVFRSVDKGADLGFKIDDCELVLRERLWEQRSFQGPKFPHCCIGVWESDSCSDWTVEGHS